MGQEDPKTLINAGKIAYKNGKHTKAIANLNECLTYANEMDHMELALAFGYRTLARLGRFQEKGLAHLKQNPAEPEQYYDFRMAIQDANAARRFNISKSIKEKNVLSCEMSQLESLIHHDIYLIIEYYITYIDTFAPSPDLKEELLDRIILLCDDGLEFLGSDYELYYWKGIAQLGMQQEKEALATFNWAASFFRISPRSKGPSLIGEIYQYIAQLELSFNQDTSSAIGALETGKAAIALEIAQRQQVISEIHDRVEFCEKEIKQMDSQLEKIKLQ